MSKKSREDWDLWERVKKTAVPLNANRAKTNFQAAFDEQSLTASRPVQPNRLTRIVKPYSPEPAIQVSFASRPPILDETTSRKIARGKTTIDGRIDLHGMTQDEAYGKLYRFLDSAFRNQRRTVLIITGKGVKGEGILKQAVPRWLSEPLFKDKVVGFREAHITHGGSGALYVRLRNQNREKGR